MPGSLDARGLLWPPIRAGEGDLDGGLGLIFLEAGETLVDKGLVAGEGVTNSVGADGELPVEPIDMGAGDADCIIGAGVTEGVCGAGEPVVVCRAEEDCV